MAQCQEGNMGIIHCIACIILLAALTACNGGGSGGDARNTNEEPNTEAIWDLVVWDESTWQ